MNNKELLNEEKYQKSKTGVNKTGKLMITVGIIMIMVAVILIIVGILNFGGSGSLNYFALFIIGGFLLIFGFAIAGFGGQLFFIGHGREIASFMAQQAMPVAQESIDKMAPTIGKAAGEVAKGIKEGLKEDNNE